MNSPLLQLLVPPIRTAVFKFLASRMKVQSYGYQAAYHQSSGGRDDVIDGEFEEVEEFLPGGGRNPLKEWCDAHGLPASRPPPVQHAT